MIYVLEAKRAAQKKLAASMELVKSVTLFEMFRNNLSNHRKVFLVPIS